MSSKNKKRQARNKNRAQHSNNPATHQSGASNQGLPTGGSPTAGRNQPNMRIWFVLAVLAVCAGVVVYAVSGPKGSKTEARSNPASNTPPPVAAASTTTPPVAQTPAPVPPATSAPPAAAALVQPQAQPAPPAPVVPAQASGPKIQFATPIFDFGKTNGGAVVKHDYYFTNVGNAVLEVTDVRPSCGCTTAGEWTHKVEPGQSGVIPIAFNTGNYTGYVGKSITVTCNDPTQTTVILQINGTVWRPIEVTPLFAILNTSAEAPSNAVPVRILNNQEQPLVLSNFESQLSAFALELITNQPGKEYQLLVKTAFPWPTNSVQGLITIKTSATNMPVISINAWANVQPILMPIPNPVMLPAPPLTNALTLTVTIRNNGTNAAVLSEPSINAKGVDVQMNEIQPGRYYNVILKFPAGFEIAPTDRIELSVKSSPPQFPVVKVPVTQPPRPPQAAIVPAPPPVQPAPAPKLAEAPATNAGSPKIQFENPVYNFGKINGGDVVQYSYIFTNVGNVPLELSAVNPSCSCLKLGDWPRKVEPGKTGAIPVSFNSGHYMGELGKWIDVICNDPSQSTVQLKFNGTVWRAIEINPPSAGLNLCSEVPSNSATVRIISHLDQPVTLSDLQCQLAGVAMELTTNQPGKEYQLTVRTVPPWPVTSQQGQITMKTSATNASSANCNVYVNVLPTVMTIPYVIKMPALPLASPFSYMVWVRNNGTNTLALSEPAVNAKGVEVKMKEENPGHEFILTLNFPAGFDVAPGEKLELSVKSNHPQFPLIKVPGVLLPRAAPAQSTAPAPAAQPAAH